MRLKQILTENNDYKLHAKIFDQPWFKNNDDRSVLFRKVALGNEDVSSIKLEDGIYFISTNANRPPRDTFALIHLLVNTLSKKRFGFGIRSNNVFFSYNSVKGNLDEYDGILGIAIPYGDYELYYSEGVNDFTYDFKFGTLETNYINNINSLKVYKYVQNIIDKGKYNRLEERNLTSFIYNLLQDQFSFLVTRIIHNAGFKYNKEYKKENFSIKKFNKIVSQNKETIFDDVLNLEKFIDKNTKKEIQQTLPSDFLDQLKKLLLEDVDILVDKEMNEYIETIKKYVDSIQKSKSISGLNNEEIICHCKEYYFIHIDKYKELLSDKEL